MTDNEAYRIIGERVKEIIKLPEIQRKAIEIADRDGIEAAKSHIYRLAIASLIYPVM